MTPIEAAKITAVLLVAYPDKAIPVELYERLLVDLDYATTNAAIERLLATSKWPPTIAEIRAAALALTVGEVRPGGDAWGDVLRLRSPRPEAEFERLDPVIARCLDRLGMLRHDTVLRAGAEVRRWRVELGDNEAADRARFIELYDQLAAAHRSAQLSESLPAVRQLRAAQQRQSLGDGQARALGQLVGEVARRTTP